MNLPPLVPILRTLHVHSYLLVAVTLISAALFLRIGLIDRVLATRRSDFYLLRLSSHFCTSSVLFHYYFCFNSFVRPASTPLSSLPRHGSFLSRDLSLPRFFFLRLYIITFYCCFSCASTRVTNVPPLSPQTTLRQTAPFSSHKMALCQNRLQEER